MDEADWVLGGGLQRLSGGDLTVVLIHQLVCGREEMRISGGNQSASGADFTWQVRK